MKVAYVFATSGHTASYKLGQMILPQIEQDRHGAEVVGMFFFDDNAYLLRSGDPMGERLAEQARRLGILLMLCDRCAFERRLARRAGGVRAARHRRWRLGRLLPGTLFRPGWESPDQVITL